jgi:hypothetical protein
MSDEDMDWTGSAEQSVEQRVEQSSHLFSLISTAAAAAATAAVRVLTCTFWLVHCDSTAMSLELRDCMTCWCSIVLFKDCRDGTQQRQNTGGEKGEKDEQEWENVGGAVENKGQMEGVMQHVLILMSDIKRLRIVSGGMRRV